MPPALSLSIEIVNFVLYHKTVHGLLYRPDTIFYALKTPRIPLFANSPPYTSRDNSA